MLAAPSYTLCNALTWSLCAEHHIEASRQGCSLSGAAHLTLALLETLPILSQIISLIELLFFSCCFAQTTPPPTHTLAPTPTPAPASISTPAPVSTQAAPTPPPVPPPQTVFPPDSRALRQHYQNTYWNETCPTLTAGEYVLNGERIPLDIARSQRETRIYTGDMLYQAARNLQTRYPTTTFDVIQADTLQAAIASSTPGARVAILNLANEVSPGGGVKGIYNLAQEESISRRCTLMAAIDPDLNPHIRADFQNGTYLVPADGCIFSPDIAIFRRERYTPGQNQDLPVFENFRRDEIRRVAVITSAAVDLRNGADIRPILAEQRALMRKKVRSQILCAHLHGYDTLILGAFGCGAFGNDPIFVRELYRQVLVTEGLAQFFKHIRFSILVTRPSDQRNFDAFAATFQNLRHSS